MRVELLSTAGGRTRNRKKVRGAKSAKTPTTGHENLKSGVLVNVVSRPTLTPIASSQRANSEPEWRSEALPSSQVVRS